jgi:hypothetical protein
LSSITVARNTLNLAEINFLFAELTLLNKKKQNERKGDGEEKKEIKEERN